MSQQRARKANDNLSSKVRPATALPKTSSVIPNRQRNNNCNKLPKSVRYDLENALLGLCDIWFEELKPHLLSNNIKLHMRCEGAGDKLPSEPASNSAPAPCEHIHPGADPYKKQQPSVSCANSCSRPPTASRAHWLKQKAFQTSFRQSHSPVPIPVEQIDEDDSSNHRKKRRNKRNLLLPRPLPPSNWKVSRPCRKCITQPSEIPERLCLKAINTQESKHYGTNFSVPRSRCNIGQAIMNPKKFGHSYQFRNKNPDIIRAARKIVIQKKNKYTQTEFVPSHRMYQYSHPPVPSTMVPTNAAHRVPQKKRVSRRNKVNNAKLLTDELDNTVEKDSEAIIKVLYAPQRRDYCPSILNLPLDFDRNRFKYIKECAQ